MTEERHVLFSEDRIYRFMLRIVWDKSLPMVTVVGMNPSIADEKIDDPTIRRCKQFAKDFGAGSLCMLNLFGYRSTDPKRLADLADPIGSKYHDLDFYKQFAAKSSVTIAAWGDYRKYVPKRLYYRGLDVAGAIPNLMCLKQSPKTMMPWHPLYLPGDLKPIPFRT